MSFPSSADTASMPPPASLAIHLDLVGGLAGDMFVAALVDALPALAAPVMAELAAVRSGRETLPSFRETSSGGLRAAAFGTVPEANAGGWARAERPVTGGRAPVRAHRGTAYTELCRRLADAPLGEGTRTHALALLALLAQAEAHAHGTSIDAVHFHELADWDSLMDVVAAGCIAATLEGALWSASALPLGGGSVGSAHGRLPVPSPAASFLLAGYKWHDDGVEGERVTPTGAAILRHLMPAARCAMRRAGGVLLAVGCGAGTRTLPDMPNVVRAMVLERADEAGHATDQVTVIEFDVDDMTGEEIAVAGERLRAQSGMLDLTVGTRQGKKGRLVADFRLLLRPDAADAIARACFTETSTLGLRLRDEGRRVLQRAEVGVDVDGGSLRVKIAQRPSGTRSAKTEHDDVAATPGLGKRRRKRAAAVRGALAGDDA